MENQTAGVASGRDLDRTLLWAAWCKEAFGKAIVKTGWDPDDGLPTAELYENPSTVYYGWSKRYGNRKLAWALVTDELDVSEANARYGVDLPLDQYGGLHMSSWTGALDQGDMDQRPEQQQEIARYVNAVEYWELAAELASPIDPATGSRSPLAAPHRRPLLPHHRRPGRRRARRGIRGRSCRSTSSRTSTSRPGRTASRSPRSPSRSTRPSTTCSIDSTRSSSSSRGRGSRASTCSTRATRSTSRRRSTSPLREGEDIAQIDARVDFFPSELHAGQLCDGQYKSTGPDADRVGHVAERADLGPGDERRVARGRAPAHRPARQHDARYRAIYECWWDYAEEYRKAPRKSLKGYAASRSCGCRSTSATRPRRRPTSSTA
jgi:hypothetical protein